MEQQNKKEFTEEQDQELESISSQVINLDVDIKRRESDLEAAKIAIENDIKRLKKKRSDLHQIVDAARKNGWMNRIEKEAIEREENQKRKLEKAAKEAAEKEAK